MNLSNKTNPNKKIIPKEYNDFNWGACILTYIWGIPYKAWITLLAIPLLCIELPLKLNWVLFAAFQIYCGCKGNEWAYQIDYRKSVQEFNKIQIKWAICATLALIIIPFSMMMIVAHLINKSPDILSDFSNNASCTIAHSKIQKRLSKINITKSMSGVQIAQNFVPKFNRNLEIDNNAVIFTKDKKKLYNIIFYKQEFEDCDIEKENCVINSSIVVPTGVFNNTECTFYFDNNGNIKPDKNTQNALKKGINIFKYL